MGELGALREVSRRERINYPGRQSLWVGVVPFFPHFLSSTNVKFKVRGQTEQTPPSLHAQHKSVNFGFEDILIKFDVKFEPSRSQEDRTQVGYGNIKFLKFSITVKTNSILLVNF